MICCPFHSDKTPSGRISHGPDTKSPGYFKCYGCGKTCKWDELADTLGLAPFKSKPKVRYAEPVQHIDDIEDTESSSDEKLQFFQLPRNKYWRTISTNLLIDIGCKLCTVHYSSGYTSPKFIWMPVMIDEKMVGYIKARMRKDPNKTSYINLKGSWVLTHGLFPFDYAINMMTDTKTIVLVEGQRDALRLISLGIPAMCIMGTQSWSAHKCQLLEMHGVERCIIFMDGDDAGISGTKKVYSILSNYIDCVVIKLWSIKGSPYLDFADEEHPSKVAKEHGVDLWDPGNCPEYILHKIYNRYIAS